MQVGYLGGGAAELSVHHHRTTPAADSGTLVAGILDTEYQRSMAQLNETGQEQTFCFNGELRSGCW